MRPCATLAALTDSWHVFDIISQVLLKLLVLILLLILGEKTDSSVALALEGSDLLGLR